MPEQMGPAVETDGIKEAITELCLTSQDFQVFGLDQERPKFRLHGLNRRLCRQRQGLERICPFQGFGRSQAKSKVDGFWNSISLSEVLLCLFKTDKPRKCEKHAPEYSGE